MFCMHRTFICIKPVHKGETHFVLCRSQFVSWREKVHMLLWVSVAWKEEKVPRRTSAQK
jgi:hypothetical protein